VAHRSLVEPRARAELQIFGDDLGADLLVADDRDVEGLVAGPFFDTECNSGPFCLASKRSRGRSSPEVAETAVIRS
jgi:hypothetical protein